MPEELDDGPSGRRGSQSASLKKVPNDIIAFIASLALYIISAITSSQAFHEELALQWILCRSNCRPIVLTNSWFFFELLVSEGHAHTHTHTHTHNTTA